MNQRERERLVALAGEMDAATSLARHGLRVLAEYRFAATDAESLFVNLAGATEKLLKLTIGLASEDDGAGWPTKKEMRGRSHRISDLDQSARALVLERLDRSALVRTSSSSCDR